MKRRDPRKYLFDITEAAALLRRFVTGKTFEDYQGDPLLRSAVERQFEIIGEALNQLVRLDPEMAARISNTARIIAFRNVLIHAYASVSHEVVWGVIETKLPILEREVESLLREAEADA
mgnify:CR=1 FL=1